MEIVSPALNSDSDWKSQLATIWDVLSRYFDIHQSTSCSTHIHVSLPSKWTLPSLKALCKCVVYYDPVIEALVPASQRRKFWCQSNIYAPKVERDLADLRRTGFRSAFSSIDGIKCDLDVARYISPSKNFAWNFNNIGGRRKLGTVEFRRPAMSTCAQDTIQWAAFTFAFVRAAGAIDENAYSMMKREMARPRIEDLKSFVQIGARLMASNVDGLFEGKKYEDHMTEKPTHLPLSDEYMKPKRENKRSLACMVLMMAENAGH